MQTSHSPGLQTLTRSLTAMLMWCCIWSAQAVELDSRRSLIEVKHDIQYLEDPKHTLSPQQLLQTQPNWRKNPDAVFNQGYNHSSWWLRFPIDNRSQIHEWIMEISYPVLDHLDVYLIENNQIKQSWLLGDKKPFATRPILHRNFLIPIRVTPATRAEILIKVRTTSAVQVPINLWQPESFNQHNELRSALQGYFFGGLGIIAIYNLLMFLALKDRAYLYYVGYVVCVALFVACLGGWAFQYFWPNATDWNDRAIVLFLSIALFSGSMFVRLFLNTRDISKSIHRIQNTVVSSNLIVAMLTLILPYDLSIRMVIALAALTCAWGLGLGVFTWHRGLAAARYYTVAWAMLLISALVLVLSKVHILPSNVITENAIQAGTLLEAVLLSFAMAERINQERALRFNAQQQALQSQTQAREELELRVTERTQELEEANHKLLELSQTDQLTGIKNRGFLDLYLDKQIRRFAESQRSMTVLLIDADHFKPINDTHGHQVGDDCLQEIARRVENETRWPGDVAARYGGEEFCVILPDTGLAGANIVAERIRKSVAEDPVNTRIGPLNLSVSIGGYAAIPNTAQEPADFLSYADKALYAAKGNGRNQVQFFNASESQTDSALPPS